MKVAEGTPLFNGIELKFWDGLCHFNFIRLDICTLSHTVSRGTYGIKFFVCIFM